MTQPSKPTSPSLDNFEVAISYLTRDAQVAEDLYGRLADQFSVFLYPKHQDLLSGRDGMTALGKVFRSATRLVIVLYRENWGETEWTAVERDAIRDRGLKEKNWDSLIMVMLDDSAPPDWYPSTQIRYNYSEYGLEQLLGVVKSKLQELGARPRKADPLAKAARVAQEMDFRRRRQEMLESHEGVRAVRSEFESLGETLAERLEAIRTQNSQIAFRFGRNPQVITISSSVSMQATWIPPYANRVGPMQVLWTNFGVALPDQMSLYPEAAQKHRLAQWKVMPEVTGDYQWVWAPSTQPDLRLTTEELADFLLQEFLELFRKRMVGDIAPPKDFPF